MRRIWKGRSSGVNRMLVAPSSTSKSRPSSYRVAADASVIAMSVSFARMTLRNEPSTRYRRTSSIQNVPLPGYWIRAYRVSAMGSSGVLTHAPKSIHACVPSVTSDCRTATSRAELVLYNVSCAGTSATPSARTRLKAQ
jgi:hypothetical protein